MDFTSTTFIGRITIAAGVTAAIQIILLILMFSVATEPYGPISDYVYAITPILMIPMMFAFRHIYQAQHVGGSQWALVLGIIGAAIASLNQVVFLLKVIDLKQSMLGASVGIGLIGITILLYSLFSRTSPDFPNWFVIFGVVLGVAMALGLIFGPFFLDDVFALSTGSLDYANMKPIMYLVMLAGAINQLGLPVWLLILGRMFLIGKLNISTL